MSGHGWRSLGYCPAPGHCVLGPEPHPWSADCAPADDDDRPYGASKGQLDPDWWEYGRKSGWW